MSAPFDLNAYIAERSKRILAALDRYTPPADTEPASLHTAMRYSLLGGSSKLIRPLLCIAGAEAVGGAADTVLPTACALEMVHTFSLIHDDLPALDNDDYRRGQPTSHKKFGEAMAILAGDALHTLAFSTLATHQTTDDPTRLVRVIRLFADACGEAGMVGGQVDDMEYEGRPVAEVTPDILRHIHARKTGALLTVSIQSGAILSGATSAQEAALTEYGQQVGVAFQIVDDILDVIGDEAIIGKPVGSDEKNDKATYPKLFGLEAAKRLAREASQAAVSALWAFDDRADALRAFARFIVEREM
jgi:geranylgeranyl diphosphate synthase, type II